MLIQKYTSDWIRYFEELKLEIDNVLKGLNYRIEHVGSTSVPLLASKPIIDIDIINETETEFEKIKSRLLQVGYHHNGNQGIPNREVFKRKGEPINHILDGIAHHLYVCPIHSKALNRHIEFRNHLRKNDLARLEYQTMKYSLAEKANQNKKVYAELKELYTNDFIDKTLTQEYLYKIGTFSEENTSLLERQLIERKVLKDEILLAEGNVCSAAFFIVSGCFYQFVVKDVEEKIIDLHIENEWFLNHSSFICRKPSNTTIKAYSDSIILELSIESIHYLVSISPAFLHLGTILDQPAERLYYFDTSATSHEKYGHLMGTRPDLMQRFPQWMVASYLKMAPKTLSRVRNIVFD